VFDVMFNELKIALYDIFGYLVPGSIILIAVVVLFWSLFWPSAPASFPHRARTGRR
jgi:hypothetical protein